MFVAVYRSENPIHWGYGFRPQYPGQEPACWAWAPEGSEVKPADDGVPMIFEPGKRSPRFAHELYFETERRDDLPIRLVPPG